MTPTDPRARIVAALEKIEATKAANAHFARFYSGHTLVALSSRLLGTGSEPGPVETILREALVYVDKFEGRYAAKGLLGWLKIGGHSAALLLADHINEGETK